MRTWLLLALALLVAAPAWGDGMMFPGRITTDMLEHPERMPPVQAGFTVPYHRVKVAIDRQVASTQVDQAFRSGAGRPIEATYVFPVADGMAISRFSLFAGGEELPHRLLGKEEARRIYNGIVMQRKDPGLLEYLGTGAIQARVFPVEPGQDKPVRIRYEQVLPASGGVVKYTYPLRIERLAARPLGECSLEVTINAARPLRSIYSPTHQVVVTRQGERRAKVTWQAKNVTPDQDFVLYYTVSPQDLGVDLLTYRDADREEGFFLLLAAPRADVRTPAEPKDVVFVLDTSGSMEGKKLIQAKEALGFCIERLGNRDRFNVISFNTEVRRWEGDLQPAGRAGQARAFVGGLSAGGGTDIDSALREALDTFEGQTAGRTPMLIFLTDGQPTVGQTNAEQILKDVRAANRHRVRLFDFGVGEDYNAHLLDKLADQNHGYAENVLPGENIEAKVSGFYTKVASPVLVNLQLDWGGLAVRDCYPRELPDLFTGSQLAIVGRYSVTGEQAKGALRLSGEAAGRRQTFSFPVVFPAQSLADGFIPRLWATRKIGYLEDEARLEGTRAELIEEIVALSKEYGILTEYTSFLVDADAGRPVPLALGPAGPALREAEQRVRAARMATGGSYGVSQSVNRKQAKLAMQVASPSGNVIMDAGGNRVQLDRMRNLFQRTFVQSGSQWVDVRYRHGMKELRVQAFSPAYLQLANAHLRLGQYLSQAANVTVALQTQALVVGDDGREQAFSAAELKALLAEMTATFGPGGHSVHPAVTKPAGRPRRSAAAPAAGLVVAAAALLVVQRRRHRG